MNPEVYSYLFDELFNMGAKDVYLTNILMKKNRPGVKLSVLCLEEDSEEFEEILFCETTTLGIRKTKVDRVKLERRFIKVETKYGPLTLKIAYDKNNILKYAPEYEECKILAKSHGVAIMEVYQEAIRATDLDKIHSVLNQ